MEDAGALKIVKVNHTATPLKQQLKKTAKAPMPSVIKHTSKHRSSQPKYGVLKHGKTARKTPRFEGVKDPAKAPPISKRKATLRILTEKGVTRRRKTIEKQVEKMPIHLVRATLRKSGLPVSDKTPDPILRKILAGGQEAGMVSLG